MALKNMPTREIKYTRKAEKSAFREIFVARYIPILQYIKKFKKTLEDGWFNPLGTITLTHIITILPYIKVLLQGSDRVYTVDVCGLTA